MREETQDAQKTAAPDEPERIRTMDETDRKCPQCGGTMDYCPETEGLKCPYCDYTEDIPEDTEALHAEEIDFHLAEAQGNCAWGVEKKTVICESCGAEAIYDARELANICPYCGSNQVMEELERDTLAPGGVCGFRVTMENAAQRFKKWLSRRLFCPRTAKKYAKPESFKGIYLPYWTFDTETSTAYHGRYGVTHTSRDREGNTRVRTVWHHVSGTYRQFINDHLVVGSTRYDRSILRRIEPFDTEDNRVYRPEYIAGFIAERYSVGLEEAWQSAREEIKHRLEREIEEEIMSRYSASQVDLQMMNVNYQDVKFKYLLLPIWLSAFTYKNKVYHFVVNGQTGKVGGKTPISPLRVLIAVLLGLGLAALLVLLSEYLR